MTPLPRLYAIADASFGDPVHLAQELFAGGASLVQIRNKKASAGDLLQQVRRIIALAPPDVRVIVNDRVDIALVAGAAGVHLGQDDLPPLPAREILGPKPILGFSTHNLQQAMEADRLPVDYIGFGPIFATSTKENPDPVVGIGKLAEICALVHKPVVAIGGIRLDQAAEVLAAGAHSVAIVRDLLTRSNIADAVQSQIALWSKGKRVC
jgi:thiamine-phosphate pyrophosphorylase